MSRVITIGREFGSGGRELGRRLADHLNMAYYDQEIITAIAQRTELSVQYIQGIVEQRPVTPFPITVAHSFNMTNDTGFQMNLQVFQAQRQIIEEMAEKSDCIFVGRCADYILRGRDPFRIFVYADTESKIARCRRKAPEQEKESLTDKEIRRNLEKIDRNRAKYYAFYTQQPWGDKVNYDLCLNTSRLNLKQAAAKLAELALIHWSV